MKISKSDNQYSDQEAQRRFMATTAAVNTRPAKLLKNDAPKGCAVAIEETAEK